MIGAPSAPSTSAVTRSSPTMAMRRLAKRTDGPAHLVGDLAPARVGQVVDGDGDGRQQLQLLALGRARALKPPLNSSAMKPVDSLPLAPARMLHQRGQERDVVLDAVDDEGVERVGLQVDGGLARGRMRHQLGDHRIVEHGDLAALEDAGVVADGAAVGEPSCGRPVAH